MQSIERLIRSVMWKCRRIGRRLRMVSAVGVLSMFLSNSLAEAQNLLWARRSGSGGAPSIPQDVGQAIAVDRFGNSYVTGQFRNTATFGPGQPNQTILTATGAQQEIFTAKYDTNGFLQWARRISTAEGQGNGIGVDAAGNVYVTGFFNLSGTFAPGEGNQVILTPFGVKDIFLAKYDTDGNFIWAKQAGSTFTDQAQAIAVDGLGNSYMTGRFADVATFGAGDANQTVLTVGNLSEDAFIAKYNSNGLLQWAKQISGASSDQAFGIAIDGAGNSYVTGGFSLTATFGAGEANQTQLIAPVGGNTDIFVAKYNTSGLLQWAKRNGQGSHDRGFAIAADQAGNNYVTGFFQGSVVFGQGDPNQTTLNADLVEDIFIAKYNTNGALQWAKRAGSSGSEFGQGIAVDVFGNSYVTGYGGFLTFGPGEANETIVGTAGVEDIFIAKYDPNGLLLWAKSAGSGGTDKGLGIALDGLGNVLVTGQFVATAIFGQGEPNQTSLVSAGSADVFVAKYAAGPILVSCPTDSLQTAINLAAPGQTILVSGTCNENILIRNEKQRITIDGAGAGVGTRATINAPGGSPGFNVRGKGILIQNIIVTGGNDGVVVNRGSNAVLNNNIIQSTGGVGVKVEQLSFAVLTNNLIENNPDDGVSVQDNSTARIGFNADSDTTASVNTIQNNGGRGIKVGNGAHARIIGNTISGNGDEGIKVERDSSADIASNVINGNQADGIKVESNSLIQLGEDSGATIYETPNSTTVNNQGAGIRCDDGSVVDGRQGTLNGNGGATDIRSSCGVNSLN